jgi:hypothetical protein
MNTFAEPLPSPALAAASHDHSGPEPAGPVQRVAANGFEVPVLQAAANRRESVQTNLQARRALDASPRVTAQAKLASALSNAPVQRRCGPLKKIDPLTGTAPQGGIEEDAVIQSKSVNSTTGAVAQREPANRTGLPDSLKSGVEAMSGLSMDDVRVHYNSDKPAQLQAHAYTQGSDIHVAPGQEQHLAHEAWHVVQQKQGRVAPTAQLKGVALNDDDSLEKEADLMGARAVQMKAEHPSEAPLSFKQWATQGAPIQRKIGYEYETNMTITREDGEFEKRETLVQGNKWELTPDEIRDGGKTAEGEFVTDPLGSRDEIISVVGHMATYASGLGDIRQEVTHKDEEMNFLQNVQKENFENEGNFKIDTSLFHDPLTAAPQATIDLDLAEVGALFRQSRSNVFSKKSIGKRDDNDYSITAFEDGGDNSSEGELLVDIARLVGGYNSYNGAQVQISDRMKGLLILIVSYIANSVRQEAEDRPQTAAASAKEIAPILSRVSFKSYWLGLSVLDKQILQTIIDTDEIDNGNPESDRQEAFDNLVTDILNQYDENAHYKRVYPAGYQEGTGATGKVQKGPKTSDWLDTIVSSDTERDELSPPLKGSPSMGERHVEEGTTNAVLELRRLPKGIQPDAWVAYALDVLKVYTNSLKSQADRKPFLPKK